jgi:hypothetical protein
MISADHWHDNSDGTAWTVIGSHTWDLRSPKSGVHPDWNPIALDRPCDTCDGVGGAFRPNGSCIGTCTECSGTGRHTFTIAVEGDGLVVTHSVSVVPGMIKRIRDNETDRDDPPYHSGDIFVCADGSAYHDTAADYMTDITLPPAGKTGMWAVKVNIHD